MSAEILRARSLSGPAPDLSLIVPTFGRSRALMGLLGSLCRQRLPASRFELLLVDDGGPESLPDQVLRGDWPFALEVLRQPNAGPASARNRGIQLARAPLLVILNDDALLSPEALGQHLEAQRAAPRPEAVLGRFDFLPELWSRPLVDVFQHRDQLLFPYSQMVDGALHGGAAFWTCNLSVPREDVLAVGGFDERFRHPIAEDSALGLDLEHRRGLRVRFRADIRAWHDHDVGIGSLMRRRMWAGWYQPIYAEHLGLPAAELAAQQRSLRDRTAGLELRGRLEALSPQIQGLRLRLERPGATHPRPGHPQRTVWLDAMAQGLATISAWSFERGKALAATGCPLERMVRDPLVDLPLPPPVVGPEEADGRCDVAVGLTPDHPALPDLQTALHRWPDVAAVGPGLPGGFGTSLRKGPLLFCGAAWASLQPAERAMAPQEAAARLTERGWLLRQVG